MNIVFYGGKKKIVQLEFKPCVMREYHRSEIVVSQCNAHLFDCKTNEEDVINIIYSLFKCSASLQPNLSLNPSVCRPLETYKPYFILFDFLMPRTFPRYIKHCYYQLQKKFHAGWALGGLLRTRWWHSVSDWKMLKSYQDILHVNLYFDWQFRFFTRQF